MLPLLFLVVARISQLQLVTGSSLYGLDRAVLRRSFPIIIPDALLSFAGKNLRGELSRRLLGQHNSLPWIRGKFSPGLIGAVELC